MTIIEKNHKRYKTYEWRDEKKEKETQEKIDLTKREFKKNMEMWKKIWIKIKNYYIIYFH
jgi:hypothetical protein